MPLYIAQSGDLDRCYRCLTDGLTDRLCKDRATQLLTKYKSGALVTQSLSIILVHLYRMPSYCKSILIVIAPASSIIPLLKAL